MQNLGSLYLFLLIDWLLFAIVFLAATICQNAFPSMNDYFTFKGLRWNYFIKTLWTNFFVLFITACIGIKNLNIGIKTGSVAIDFSNITTVLHLLLCLLVLVALSYYVRSIIKTKPDDFEKLCESEQKVLTARR